MKGYLKKPGRLAYPSLRARQDPSRTRKNIYRGEGTLP